MATSSNDHNNATDDVPYTTTLTDIPSPETFYNDYVKKRRPVLLKDCCGRVTPKLMAATCSLDKLVDIVGRDAMVQVNQRKDDTDKQLHAFSPLNSTVINMKFGDLVDKLQQGSTRYYMTTQTLPLNEEGQPALYTSPVTQLVQKHHMDTLRPLLLGNLIPMTYNLWIGQATNTKPQSSGLHHDYNDNLYCLLEGNKTFQIAPPSSIVKLQTRGTLHTLHDNGRIVYQEQVQESGRIRPDGALESVERIMQLELRQEELEAKLEATNDTVQQEELQAELDAIQEELLDLEMEGETDGPNDDNENLLFGGAKNTFSTGDGDEDESDEEESEDAPNPKRARLDDDDDDDETVPKTERMESR